MTHPVCTSCGKRAPAFVGGACFFCVELAGIADSDARAGLALLGHAILKALDKPTPTPRAIAKRDEPEAPRGLITVDPAKAGGETLSDAGRTLMALDDAYEHGEGLSAAGFDRCMHAIATVRACAQKHDRPWVFATTECSAMRKLLAVYKPTQIAKMIRGAVADPFWASSALSMHVVVTHAAAWLAASSRPVPAKPADRRAVLMAQGRDLLAALRKRAPMEAEALDVDVSKVAIEAVADWVESIRRECDKRKIGATT